MHTSQNSLPIFSPLLIDTIVSDLEKLLTTNRKTIAERLAQGAPYTWDNFIVLMESLGDRLHQFWSPVSHLNAVLNSPELRDVYNACVPQLSEYGTEMGQKVELYVAYQSIDKTNLNLTQQKIIDNALRDFQLSGVALTGAARERYKIIEEELSRLEVKFEENILDATDQWQHHITDIKLLAGLPEHAIASAHAKAQAKNLPGWLLTLDMPCYLAVIQYADHRDLRHIFYHAYQTRASELSLEGKFDNSLIMEKILVLRQEKSQLLGFKNFASYSLATKMAKTPTQVIDLLQQLAQAAKPFATQELAELKKFAAQAGCSDLQAWDMSYYSEKLREEKFQINEEALRAYFPLPTVLQGMFTIIKRLYGMEVKEIVEFNRWHSSVQLFSIFDSRNNLRGQFYIDLYARTGKRSGAWMDDARGRWMEGEHQQTPIAYLTCNFAAPAQDRPALLTHNDVVTLFHEFGHCLQHLLTQVAYLSASGINGVVWDAVELPSQFFENWCWNAEALGLISCHYKTGESLPETTLQQLLAAKNFQVGIQNLRQIEFALFDFRLHTEFLASPMAQTENQIKTILQQVRDEISVFQPPEFSRFQHSFSHIFAGGYAAAYYSYKWAEVLSADAFDRFLTEGIFNRETGEQFLTTILETGGSRDAMELFIAFRGREPNIEALLKQEGLHR